MSSRPGFRRAEETMPPQVSHPVVWLIAFGSKAHDAA